MENKPININDLKIGQQIYINFIPYSQKYLDILNSKIGTIYSINKFNYFDEISNRNETRYDIKIKNNEGEIGDLLHESVSYYGNSLGYDYCIYLLN